MRKGLHVFGFAATIGAVGLASSAARAHGAGDSVPITLPPFPPGDGAKAQAAVAEIEARTAKDARLAAIVAGPLGKAKMSLQRAYGAHVVGDALHEKQLEALALEWVDVTRAVERAAAAESKGDTSVKGADEAARKVDRVRALLSETLARRARAAAELVRVRADSKETVRGAAAAEEARLANKRPLPPVPKADPPKTDPKKGSP